MLFELDGERTAPAGMYRSEVTSTAPGHAHKWEATKQSGHYGGLYRCTNKDCRALGEDEQTRFGIIARECIDCRRVATQYNGQDFACRWHVKKVYIKGKMK